MGQIMSYVQPVVTIVFLVSCASKWYIVYMKMCCIIDLEIFVVVNVPQSKISKRFSFVNNLVNEIK